MAIHLGRPLPHRLVATYPDSGAETRLRISALRMPSLFGFAPSGVYLAVDVAANAVRSYRTLSPLPHREMRRFACGTFPRGRPRRLLTGTVFPWSPDFLSRRVSLVARRRPSNRLEPIAQSAQKKPRSTFYRGNSAY